MADLIKTIITFVLSNFTLTFLVIGLICSGAAIARAPKPVSAAVVVEKLLCWYVFFSIGVSFLYNAVFHMFFGKMAAAFIGWADSPFQFEVGTASLGFAVMGFIAAFRSFDLRIGAIVPFSIFTVGAAIGHIHEMIATGNFASGNAGVIFYTDFGVPAFGLLLLWLQWRYGRPLFPDTVSITHL
jgi:hypothetical protein